MGASVSKEGPNWTLALVRDFRHTPEVVWSALTEPDQLQKWAPFDSDGNLGQTGSQVKLSTVGAEGVVASTIVTRAEPPRILEYSWGHNDIRWELEPKESGTRLKLWARIPKNFISMGAAGWHICLDVMDLALSGYSIPRIAGRDALGFEGWQRLNTEYAEQFGVELPKW